MKKTTYILLGALAILFLIIIIPSFFLRMSGYSNKDILKELGIGNKVVQRQYQDIKAIKLISIGDNPYFMICQTDIKPCESDTTTITLPDYKYFDSYKNGDTLVVSLNIKMNGNHKIINNSKVVKIDIKTPNKLNYIMSENGYIGYIKGMKGDSLSIINNSCTFLLDKADYRAVNFIGETTNFSAYNSTIDSLYIDADNYSNWKVEKCKINTEFITGSSYVDNHYGKDECKRIVWIPKSKDAKFVIDAKAVITPCK